MKPLAQSLWSSAVLPLCQCALASIWKKTVLDLKGGRRGAAMTCQSQWAKQPGELGECQPWGLSGPTGPGRNYICLLLLKVKVLVAQSGPTLHHPMGCSPPGFPVHGILQATGVGCHALLQGIFLTHWLNLGLPLCRQILYSLSHYI